TFGTSWLSRGDAKTAGRFTPSVNGNAGPSSIFEDHSAHEIAIVISPAASRRALITMEFSAVGIPLRHGKTTLRKKVTDSMQPFMQPDFTTSFAPPAGSRC